MMKRMMKHTQKFVSVPAHDHETCDAAVPVLINPDVVGTVCDAPYGTNADIWIVGSVIVSHKLPDK